MFSNAYKLAKEFSYPVIISHRRNNENCDSQYGTITIINEEGWFITAKHIFALIENYSNDLSRYRNKIAGNKSIDINDITHLQVLMGFPGLSYSNVKFHPTEDLAIAKINGFIKENCNHYPFFRSELNTLDFGMNLCILGYPIQEFSRLKTVLKSDNTLDLQGQWPMHLYPISGTYSMKLNNTIEMSISGLQGQSGGPIIDINGEICAMQYSIDYHPLNLRQDLLNTSENSIIKNQYKHVTRGIHFTTIKNFLRENNISYTEHTKMIHK